MGHSFGSNSEGYLDYQIELAAQDCQAGSDQLTIEWGNFLALFQEISRAIAGCEEYDSSPDLTVEVTLEYLPAMRIQLDKIEQYCKKFQNRDQL